MDSYNTTTMKYLHVLNLLPPASTDGVVWTNKVKKQKINKENCHFEINRNSHYSHMASYDTTIM